MSKEENFFSEEYLTNSEQTSNVVRDVQQNNLPDKSIDIDYYEISKPKRYLIRGTIIND